MDANDIQDMVEDHWNRMWEMMNPPACDEEEPEKEPTYNLYSASYQLHYGLNDLYDAISKIQNAVDDADGHPIAYKLQAALDTLEKGDNWLKELDDAIHKELERMESA